MADILQGDAKSLTTSVDSSSPAGALTDQSSDDSAAKTDGSTSTVAAPQDSVPPTDPTSTSQPNQSNSNDPLLTDKVHPEDLDARWTSWKCLVCGYVYEGQREVTTCPRCGNSDPDKFEDPN